MTIPSTTRRAGPYIGTGALVSYSFSFKTFDKAHLRVVIADSLGVESDLVLDSSALVTLNVDQEANPGGSVRYAVAGVPTALPSGYTLAILSAMPYAQGTDLPDGGDFLAQDVEDGLDALAVQLQQLAEQIGRALVLSPLSGSVSGVLPKPLAGALLGWNLAGSGLTNYTGGGGGGGITLPTIAGQSGKFLSNDGTQLLWAAAAGGGGGSFKNAKTDFGCKFDGVTDDTTALQNAVTTCENNGWALFMPEGTVILSAAIVQTKRLHLFGAGAELTILKSSAAEAYRVAVPYGSGLTFCYWHDFSIVPSVNGGGTNGFVMRLVSDGGVSVCYCSNWVMERVRIGDFGGYGLNLDNGVGNLNGFFTFTIRRCWVTNGIILNKIGDSCNIEENTITDGPTIQANKIGGRIGILYTGLTGARQVVIRSNNITTSGGFLAAINCEQLRFEKNQCEQPVYYYIPYYANDPTGAGVYGAGIYLFNSYAASFRDNTIGCGSVTTTTANGTTTNGSPTVTGLSATTNIYKGCTVRGTGIPANTRVQSIVGTTVTLTQNATANGTPALTFGYSPDSAVFMGGGTIKTVLDTNDVTSGTYWHYTISNGSYDNNTYGLSTYAGAGTSPVVNDQSTGTQYSSIEDPLSRYSQDPRFVNTFLDLVNGNPANTWPVGFTPAGASTVTRNTATPWAGNRALMSLDCVSAGTTINNGVDILPSQQPALETGWFSFCIAVKANNTTNGKVLVFGINGTPTLVTQTTVAGAYQILSGRMRVNAGNTWGLRIAVGDGAGTYSNGFGYYIGAVNIVDGPYIPTTFPESPGRRKFRHTQARLAYTPPFTGAELYDSGTNKMYVAYDSTAPSGWGAGFTP